MNVPSRQRWIRLWRNAACSGNPLPWFSQLATAYSEPHRHYHNLCHIAECLAEFGTVRHLARQPLAVEFAVWFHDAVYNPKAPDNEERSAILAKRCLAKAGIESAVAETTARLVLATKHHDSGMDVDAPVMVDVDLAILGQPEERFLEYETQIRQEYALVPAATFATKRIEIIERFLARQRIYATDWFYQKYEVAARRNLQMSLKAIRDSCA